MAVKQQPIAKYNGRIMTSQINRSVLGDATRYRSLIEQDMVSPVSTPCVFLKSEESEPIQKINSPQSSVIMDLLLHDSSPKCMTLMPTMIDEQQSVVIESDQQSFPATNKTYNPAIPYDFAQAPDQIFRHSPPQKAVRELKCLALSPTFSPGETLQVEIFVPEIELITRTILPFPDY